MKSSCKILALALCATLSGLALHAADGKNAALEALLKKRRASQNGSSGTAPADTKPEEANSAPAEPAPAAASTPSPDAKSDAGKAESKTGTKKEASNARGPKPLTFEDFDLVVKRNIFDPNRRKYVPRPRTVSAPPPPPRSSIVLKGTMKTPDAEFASFDGTLSDHRGRFEKDQELGEFRLTSITRTNATLNLDTNVFTLTVGESLSKTGDGPWNASGRSSYSSGGSYGSRSGSSGSSSSASSGSSSGSSSSPGRSAALQRLLEARRKARGN